MQALNSRYLIPATAFVTLLLTLLLFSHLAHGDPLPLPDAAPAVSAAVPHASAIVVPDPIEDPAGAYSTLRDLWRTSHLLVIMVGLLMGLRIASKRVAWFRIGWRTPATAMVLSVLAAVINAWPDNVAKLVGIAASAAIAWALTSFEPKGGEKAPVSEAPAA
jgi:hypothetical protein